MCVNGKESLLRTGANVANATLPRTQEYDKLGSEEDPAVRLSWRGGTGSPVVL